MKRHLLKLIGISIIAVCLIFTMMGNVIAQEGGETTRSDATKRFQQEYLERITQVPGLFTYEYSQGTGMMDMAFGNLVMPMSISYSVYSPFEQAMNPWGPTSEYTEYSPIGSKMPGTSVSLPSLLMGGMGSFTGAGGYWGGAGIGQWGGTALGGPSWTTAGTGLFGAPVGASQWAGAGGWLNTNAGVYPGTFGQGWFSNIGGQYQYPFLGGGTGTPIFGSRIY